MRLVCVLPNWSRLSEELIVCLLLLNEHGISLSLPLLTNFLGFLLLPELFLAGPLLSLLLVLLLRLFELQLSLLLLLHQCCVGDDVHMLKGHVSILPSLLLLL